MGLAHQDEGGGIRGQRHCKEFDDVGMVHRPEAEEERWMGGDERRMDGSASLELA